MAIPTGTPTTTSSISNLVQAAYDQYVRMALRSIPVMRSLADVKPVQQAMPGSSVVFSALGIYLAGSVFTSLAKIGKMLKAQKKDSMGAAVVSITTVHTLHSKS